MVETGEHLGFVDVSKPRTFIAYAYSYIPVFLKGGSDVDVAAFCAVLYSIHQNVHQNGLAFPAVEFHIFHSDICIYVYQDSFGIFFLYDVFNGIDEPLVEVSLFYFQSALSFFELPQVKNHIQEDLHTLGLSVDALQGGCLRLLGICLAQQSFQRSHNQCQRCSELVTYIYEHTHLFLIYSLLLLLQSQLETTCLSEHKANDYA